MAKIDKIKQANNSSQNTTYKSKDGATRTPSKSWGNSRSLDWKTDSRQTRQ